MLLVVNFAQLIAKSIVRLIASKLFIEISIKKNKINL